MDFLDNLDYDIKQEEIDDSIGLYIQNYDFINMDHANDMAQYVRNVYNSHRQWRLQGHSPDKVRKFADAGESKEPGKTDNVYNIRTKKKIGRNKPCPCGNGKKYKKCCGK